MGLLERVSLQMSADIDGLLEQVNNKELTIFQLICDMEESIVDLRRETVTAVAHQNRLRKQLFSAEEVARDVEVRASLALNAGDERRARHILGGRIGALKRRDALEMELVVASQRASRLVAALIRMEDRAQLARRTKDDLVRRRRATVGDEPRHACGTAVGTDAFAAYADTVATLEAESEASHDVPADRHRPGGRERVPLEGGDTC